MLSDKEENSMKGKAYTLDQLADMKKEKTYQAEQKSHAKENERIFSTRGPKTEAENRKDYLRNKNK